MNKATPSQLLLGTVIVFILFKTAIAYRKNRLSKTFTIFWIVFWIGVLFLVVQQGLTTTIANFLGVGRGVDLIIYLALIVIFYALYKIFIILNFLDRKLTILTRKLALRQKKIN